MKNGAVAAILVVAMATSTAALAAPKADSATGYDEPGKYFSCIIPYPGPKAFRTGGCWLDGATPA